jgi:hypothetical protein
LTRESTITVLDRVFEAPAPNRKWIADFTCVWTAEGWLYVAAVVDLVSRRVAGWSMSAAMTAQLVTDALMMAIWRRGNGRIRLVIAADKIAGQNGTIGREFCRGLSPCPRGYTVHRDDIDHRVFCFADPAHADLFAHASVASHLIRKIAAGGPDGFVGENARSGDV